MSPTACGAWAETFIRNAELRRCSGKWNLGPFVLCFLPTTTMSQLAQLSLSPHLLPLFCHQLENVWPTTILDAGSSTTPFQASEGEHSPCPACKLNTVDGTFLSCASLGYFFMIHFQSSGQPLGRTESEKPFKLNQPCSKLSSLMQTITQDSYKCLSKHFHILLFLLSNWK